MKDSVKKIFDNLRFCNYKLSFVLEITQKIINNSPIEEIMLLLSDLLTEKLSIKQFLFYYKEEDKWILKFALGVDQHKYKYLSIENKLTSYREITMIRSEDKDIGHFDFVIPVLYKESVLAYLLVGDLEDKSIGMSPVVKNLKFVQTIANIIVMAMEKRKLILQSIERERIKKELETASRIQRMLMPDMSILPKSKKYEVYSYYQPHFELGGDLYDLGVLSKDEFYFAIADVSGKGLSAALLMANFQANLRAQIASSIPFEQIVRNLNDIVIRNSEGNHFITMFLGKYNHCKHRLIYINAGHQPGLLYDKVQGRISVLTEGSVGIGMVDKIPKIRIGKVIIKNSSKLLVFTDGITELAPHRNIATGMKKLSRLISNDLDIEETMKRIIKEFKLSKSNSHIFDDITLLGFEFNV